jgi:hypothetical protein
VDAVTLSGELGSARGRPALAFQGDEITLSGRTGGDTWQPAYSWHGFRFIELNLPAGATLLDKVPQLRSDWRPARLGAGELVLCAACLTWRTFHTDSGHLLSPPERFGDCRHFRLV